MMNNKGLGKLIEECGELTQVAGKKLAMMDSDDHWDGSNLKTRLEEEIADVMGAIHFVSDKFRLDVHAIEERGRYKNNLFHYWDAGGTKPKPTLHEIIETIETARESRRPTPQENKDGD